MAILPKSVQNLINEFAKLPGIGPKTASRLAFYLLKQPDLELEQFAKILSELQKSIIYCSVCHNMTENDPCSICADPKRNHNLICIVEDPLDVVAMDQVDDFNGVYHVLGGVISPLDGIGPDALKVEELLVRLAKDKEPKEVIFATNLSLEGEATSMFIAKKLKEGNFKHIKITRIGRGLPMGEDLEYADGYTLTKAMEGRKEF